MWLIIVDTTQIQPYIFGSNRLRENVGASYLVDAATRDWAFEAVKDAARGKTNIGPDKMLIEGAWIEHGLDAEVLYAGGGNFVVLFGDEEKARAFTSNLSLRALQEAPGLQLVIARQEMNWHKHVLSHKLETIFHTLAVQKRNHAWSAPLLGLGVTASCGSTGLPATGVVPGIRGEPGYLASDEIQAKVGAVSLANQRLKETIKLAAGYSYPYDFENLGASSGEYSHMAVVHADGNGIGQRIRDIGTKYARVEENRDCVLELRRFSTSVEDAAKKALNVVVDRLVRCITGGDSGKVIVYEPNQDMSINIKLAKDDRGGYYIPFRPIVFGGDDVTFVCDGRLGLSLTTAYLREFEQQADRQVKDGGRLTACAGVAIVKSHYPFARAYTLAAELTRSAKFYRTERRIAGSCLDWHFALSGLGGTIKEIRGREYRSRAGSLTLRPVTLDTNPRQGQHAWPVVLDGIQAFQKKDWMGRRNKIKALRDALREGPSAIEHFLVAFNKGDKLPQVLPEMQDWPSRGWQAGWCGYFDAIELVDWFIPLEGEVNAAPATLPAS